MFQLLKGKVEPVGAPAFVDHDRGTERQHNDQEAGGTDAPAAARPTEAAMVASTPAATVMTVRSGPTKMLYSQVTEPLKRATGTAMLATVAAALTWASWSI